MFRNALRAATALAILLPAGLASAQEIPKMKMTTEIPEGVITPDNIQTRVGELNFFDGVPDVESAQKVYNLLDFTHAYQTHSEQGQLSWPTLVVHYANALTAEAPPTPPSVGNAPH